MIQHTIQREKTTVDWYKDCLCENACDRVCAYVKEIKRERATRGGWAMSGMLDRAETWTLFFFFLKVHSIHFSAASFPSPVVICKVQAGVCGWSAHCPLAMACRFVERLCHSTTGSVIRLSWVGKRVQKIAVHLSRLIAHPSLTCGKACLPLNMLCAIQRRVQKLLSHVSYLYRHFTGCLWIARIQDIKDKATEKLCKSRQRGCGHWTTHSFHVLNYE